MPKQLNQSRYRLIPLPLTIVLLGAIYFFTTINSPAKATNNKISSGAPNQLGVGYAVTREIPINVDGIYFIDMVLDESSNTIFALYETDIAIQINLNTGETHSFAVPEDTSSLTLSPDGQKLYLASYSGSKIHVYDMATLTLTHTFNYNVNFQDIVSGNNNRLYIVGLKNGPPDGISVVEIINTTNGNVIDSFTLTEDQYQEHLLEINPGKDTLFIAYRSYFTPAIKKFDITNDDLTEMASDDLENIPKAMQISSDGNYLLLGLINNKLVRYNTESLDLVDTTPSSLGDSATMIDVSISPHGEEVTGLFRLLGEVWTIELQTYLASDGSALRTYDNFQEFSDSIRILTLDNDHIALMKRSTLEIITPTYYGIALPTIMNNYCTTPYIDDFSNANSGWPITVSNATTYQYNNDEYQIYHGLANRWTAVSIGHVMDNTETMTIEGRLANNRDGVVGIVFGLNNDWSHYYTFEILPHHGLWAVFYFNEQTGWQTIQSGDSSLINAGSQINKLRIQGTGETQGRVQFALYVNDYFITWQNAEPGRVGITGSSFVSGVDLHYDNYLFADDNCPVTPPFQSDRTLDSFINSDANHPSLNSLLNMNQD